MRHVQHLNRSLALGISLALSCLGRSLSAASDDTSLDLDPAQLLSTTAGEDWPSYHGDYTGRRFSSLAEITPSNVPSLRAQWVFHSPNSNNLEATPVVHNGVLFMTSANDAFALDARTGRT